MMWFWIERSKVKVSVRLRVRVNDYYAYIWYSERVNSLAQAHLPAVTERHQKWRG